MTLVKDWHECGECKHIEQQPWYEGGWWACTKHNEHIDTDDEVCSDFEPKGGWQE